MIESQITIKQLSSIDEAILLDQQFSQHFGWYKQGNYYMDCLEENRDGKRVTLMAFYNDELAGCCHLLYHSKYPFFISDNIPEINDLNVFPEFRRNKIASRLFDELEAIASRTSRYIGLGVGLYKDYGNAQIMYGKRGYVMDGKGISYDNKLVEPGHTVMVDDELLVYLIKELY
ncbi:GNAT family N-acetyltransferase [Paenibacillus segetis]|uniref:N-acetyltransferase n=1 Tax=Paenibacillus segetis TaxID=1325360 RepID=A0ABQ1YJJ1_9BACL|nr:GNAT family N-acetyltransferase [Paenibacillus segetis]GGH26966.1 N-acetyltransferase [Paenibacillus segetis]